LALVLARLDQVLATKEALPIYHSTRFVAASAKFLPTTRSGEGMGKITRTSEEKALLQEWKERREGGVGYDLSSISGNSWANCERNI